MQLYHFTSLYHLQGIARYGLTVGDVATDIDRLRGQIGVWLTSSPTPDGHGLAGGVADKKQFRLLVDAPDGTALKKWSVWSKDNITERTREALRAADGFKEDDFYIYFGWIRPDQIIDVVEVTSGMSVTNWRALIPVARSLPGIPFGARIRWQKRMLRSVRNVMSIRASSHIS